jgi:DNA-binding NarL/FixJ family response regulator
MIDDVFTNGYLAYIAETLHEILAILKGQQPSEAPAVEVEPVEVEPVEVDAAPAVGRKVASGFRKVCGNRRWSSREENVLVVLAGLGKERDEIGRELGRSRKAIKERVAEMIRAGRWPSDVSYAWKRRAAR